VFENVCGLRDDSESASAPEQSNKNKKTSDSTGNDIQVGGMNTCTSGSSTFTVFYPMWRHDDNAQNGYRRGWASVWRAPPTLRRPPLVQRPHLSTHTPANRTAAPLQLHQTSIRRRIRKAQLRAFAEPSDDVSTLDRAWLEHLADPARDVTDLVMEGPESEIVWSLF
jgi:hypothetical protein